MHWMHVSLRLTCGSVLLAAVGCYSYSPYGSAGYPGMYSAPPGGAPPYQGGAAPYQGGAQLGPPTSFPSQSQAVPEYDSQAQTFDDGSQGSKSFDSPSGQSDAPRYQPPQNGSGGASSSTPENGNAVPEYEDPNSLSQPLPSGDNGNGSSNGEQQQDGKTQEDRQKSGPTDSELDEENTQSPFSYRVPDASGSDSGFNDDDEFRGGVELAAAEEAAEPFQPPVKAQPSSSTRTLIETSGSTGAAGPDPYAYDSENYRWLRGKAHYDEQDDSWQLIYSLNPSAEDEFGGSITLMDHPQLRGLPDKSVVLVEGRVDRQQTDTFGKPQYRVERLARLTPRGQ